MSKKASATVSFSWILVAIIGTFILLTAGSIVNKYKAYQDHKFEIAFKENLYKSFSQIAENVDVTENKLITLETSFKGKTIEPLCLEGITVFKVNEIFDQNNHLFRSNPFFTSKLEIEKNDKVYLGTQTYKLPFVITNIFLMTSGRNLIIFDNNSIETEELLDNFVHSSFSLLNYEVRNFNKLTTDNLNNEIDERNLKQITLITSSNSNINLDELDTNAYLLNFSYEKKENYWLTNLTYYSKNNYKKSFLFVEFKDDYALSKSAIFANPESFECGLLTLNKVLDITYNYQLEKVANILNKTGNETYGPQICESVVSMYEMKSDYMLVNQSIGFVIENIGNPEELIAQLKQLETFHDILYTKDCITLY